MGGFAGEEASNEGGVGFFADFRQIFRNISKTLRDRAVVTIEH